MVASDTSTSMPQDFAPVDPELPPATTGEGDGETTHRGRKLLLLLLLLVMFAILLGVAIWYLLFRQPIPVPIIPKAETPTYSTSIYGVARPVGVAVTRDGSRIIVTQSSDERVTKVLDSSGNQVAVLDPGDGSTDHVPVYVAIDPLTSEIYITDRMKGAVYVYSKDGVFQRQFNPPADLAGWQPIGITFDGQGLLYITDLAGAAAQVEVFDRTGALVRTLGAAEGMSFPNGVAVDAAGFVYVTDSNNGRLLVFGPDGSVVARVGRGADAGKLGLPRGVAIDGQNRVFVVDTTGQGVQVERTYQAGSARLDYLGFFGGQGIADGLFGFPSSVAVDDRGHVYVTDSTNDRVQVWSY